MDLDEVLDTPGMKLAAGVNQRRSRFKPRPKTEPSEPLPSLSSDSLNLLRKHNSSIKSDVGLEFVSNVKPDFKEEEKPDFREVKPDLREEEKPDLMDMDGEVESENTVVREIDIYYVPSIDPKTNLYVLQYPLRPMWRPYELDDKCKEVRLKSASEEMEVDLSVDVDPKNHNPGADGQLPMGKQILASLWQTPACKTVYWVGVISRNKFYLHPVHAIVQLRPSLQHLDKDSKRLSSIPNDVKARVKSEVPHENLRSEQARNSEEGWVPLKYHTTTSQMVKRCLHTMTSQESAPTHISTSSYDYIRSLCRLSADRNCSKDPCIRWNLPLRERFKAWFLEGPPVHRFDALKYLAPDDSDEEILNVVQEHGRLIQGLWVPKSSLLYGTNSGLEVSARDFVLILFSKDVCISKTRIPKNPKINNAIKDVLKVLAVDRSKFDDWKLKELPDTSFAKRNPSVVKKQEDEWAKLEKKIPYL